MIKKITITSIAALSLLLVTVQAEGMKCQAGKCGSGMMKKMKQGKKMHKMRMSSPFLIKHGLPHLTRILMKNWDDKTLNLTKEQKTKLIAVRKETMGGVMRLKPEVMKLRKEIILGSRAGNSANKLKTKVEKLASLEAELTLIHLSCIEHTNAVLSKEQQMYLKGKRKAQHEARKKMLKNVKKAMKCAAGKCGGK